MKNQALIDILFLLLSREKVSAKYIADRLNVSLRSVYRYIDELSLSVPVYNTRGRNGGYSISETFKIPSAFFTTEESEFLISLLNGMNSDLNSTTLLKIIDKIKSVQKKNGNALNIDFGNLIIDGGPWGNTNTYKETITFIETCIENCYEISISYRDREGNSSEREIEPHILIMKQGLWYIYAYCHKRNEFRLFKVGRIERAIKTGKTFTRKDTSQIQQVLGAWYENLDTETIDLILDESVKADVEEWLGVDKVYKDNGGVIHASTSLPIDDYLIGKILSFKNKVKVAYPQTLKNKVITSAKEIIKYYE